MGARQHLGGRLQRATPGADRWQQGQAGQLVLEDLEVVAQREGPVLREELVLGR
jgi:hypothetical protein